MTTSAAPRPAERLGLLLTRLSTPDVDTTRFAATDAIAGGALLVLAALTASALLLADVHHHTLPGVCGLALAGLVAFGVLARTPLGGRWPGWVRDRWGLLILLGVLAVAAAMTVPGFPYGGVDKDPGGYVAQGVQIAHSGSYSFHDPVLAAAARGQVPHYSSWPSLWVRNGQTGLIVPQFYHAQQSMLALGWEAAHEIGLRMVTPLEGLCAVAALVALLRRVAGRPAALVGGLLLSVNMLQVWQARQPSSEALAEALWVGALYAVVLAVQTGWRPAGAGAGLCIGAGWLDRADGLIPVLIFAALGALLLATRRWDARAWWGLGGVSLLVPLGIWQAYAGAVTYTHANGVPSLRKVIVLVAALYVVAAGFATVLRGVSRWVVDRAGRPPAQQVAGLLVCAAALGLLVVGYLRSRLFGASYGKGSLGISGIRTYDEANLHRLTWFLSYPGVALAGLGVAVVALRRWSTTAWVFVAPSLVLTVVYLYHSHNSPQLMFWGRRYVPSVVPFFCAAAGLALAAVWRSRTMAMRAAALAATGGLVGFFLSQSLPVRGHEEWTGSFALSRRVAALSGGHGRTGGLFLVGRFGGSEGADKVLGAALWLERDQLAALLPATYTAADLRAYVRAFPGRPVFVVTQGDTPPPGAASVAYRVDVTTRLWQERVEPRPDHAVTVPEHATIWRVDTS